MIIKQVVDHLFYKAPDRYDPHRTNPVTGGRWVRGLDPIAPQKRRARRALEAREWFAAVAPEDAPPLPLSHEAREDLKVAGLSHIVAWFARSLAAQDYDYQKHPTFEAFARGVMASPYAPDFIKNDEQLKTRFLPLQLDGLGSGLHWKPERTNKP
jgi:hypothetical protein